MDSNSKTSSEKYLLEDIAIDVSDLAEYGQLPYNEFITNVMDMSSELGYDLSIDDFDTVIYPHDKIIINIYDRLITQSCNMFTFGQLLYLVGQSLRNYDEAEDFYGNHVHFDGLILNDNGSYDINY